MDLADSIKRLREKFNPTTATEVLERTAILACCMPEAIQTINQLVELVAEIAINLRDIKHETIAGIDGEITLVDSAHHTIRRVNQTLTKADALLTKLGEV